MGNYADKDTYVCVYICTHINITDIIWNILYFNKCYLYHIFIDISFIYACDNLQVMLMDMSTAVDSWHMDGHPITQWSNGQRGQGLYARGV